LIYPDLTVEFFDSIGRLVKIQDRNYNYMEFYYNISGQLSAVMDTMGRIIDFEYYPFARETDDNGIPEASVNVLSGRLHRIIDYSGRTIEFTYHDHTGDLLEVDFMGRTKEYNYTANFNIKESHNLEKIIDPLGAASNSPVLTVTYDSQDKVDKQRYIETNADIDFNIGNTSTPTTSTVTDARGNVKTFSFPTDNRLDVTNGGHIIKYEFNDDRLITRIDFPEGNYVTYEYYPAIGSNKHPAGNLHFIRQFPGPGGGDVLETEYDYQSWCNQVNYIKDPKGNETFIDHDNNGNIDKIHLPGIVQPYDYEYYPAGVPRIFGVLKSITDPEGNVTEYVYYPENNPGGGSNTVQSRMMNSTIGGYLKKVTVDKNGVNIFKSFVYNQWGNLIESEDGEGVQTIYDYIDQTGNLNPYGEVQRLIQGASGSNSGQPPANLITTFTYDANGNVDLETSSSGITIDYVFDRLKNGDGALECWKVLGAYCLAGFLLVSIVILQLGLEKLKLDDKQGVEFAEVHLERVYGFINYQQYGIFGIDRLLQASPLFYLFHHSSTLDELQANIEITTRYKLYKPEMGKNLFKRPTGGSLDFSWFYLIFGTLIVSLWSFLTSRAKDFNLLLNNYVGVKGLYPGIMLGRIILIMTGGTRRNITGPMPAPRIESLYTCRFQCWNFQAFIAPGDRKTGTAKRKK
jgi:YD repeat-containing protein